MRLINLDNNSTTPLLPEVADAMTQCDAMGYGNPASAHQLGRQTRTVLESAREEIVRLLGGRTAGRSPDRLIFTSGGTEANNLAIFGLRNKERRSNSSAVDGPPESIVISAIEHPSVVGPAERLAQRGTNLERLRISSFGVVDVFHLNDLVAADNAEQIPPIRLVSIMLGNNETGVLQPIIELTKVCRENGILVHVDAVQAAGKMPLDFQAMNISAISLSAHKIHGPRGIGALLLRHDAHLEPLFFGGFQQTGLRPGTESISLATGLLTALRAWDCERNERTAHLRKLRDHFESRLRAELPTIVVNGADAERLPHTSNMAFPGLDRQELFLALDMEGVLCSTGSACASGSSDPSPTLIAMGLGDARVRSSLRFSFGIQNSLAEVDEAIERIVATCRRLWVRPKR